MALKFLNKKGWHTGSLRNIETVWKAEQKHEGEQKKLEELRKQIQDEREKSEFRLMQEQAGLVPKQERLEFLYDSGLQVGKVAQADEYLLGKPVEEAAQPENDVGQVAAKPGALFVEEKPASANDSWRKLHSDPLFMIKQQEQAAIARITSNPVKMAGIKKAAEMKKKLKEDKKRKHKEAKRERREKRKRKKHHASSSEEDSSDSHVSPKKRKHKHDSDVDDDHIYRKTLAKSRSLSRSPTRSPVHKDRRPSPRRSKGEERQYETRKSLSRSPVLRDNDRGRARRDGYDSRGASKLEGKQREHRGNDKEFEGRESERRKRSLSRSASRSPVPRDRDQRLKGSDGRDSEKRKRIPSKSPSSRSPIPRDRDQRLKGSDGRDSEKRKWIPSRSPLRSRSQSPVRSSVVRRDHDQSRARRDEFDSRGRQREYKVSDERLKRPEDRDYGMRGRSPPRRPSRSPGRRSYGLNRPRRDDLDYRGELRHREHTSVDQRLKEPVDEDSRPRDSRELERGSKSANNGDFRSTDRVAASYDMNGLSSRQGHKGRPPKPGHQQLSDAERAARLAEMQANADVHEEQRWQRLKRAADADVVEAKRTEKDKSNEQFIADTQKSFFGAEKGNASTIEKSVKRRAHFVERSSGDNERNAFRR